MICRHPDMIRIERNFLKCTKCKVWKGEREEPHHYSYEYYMPPGLNIFSKLGIPRRRWYFNIHKKVWNECGINLDKMVSAMEIGCGIGRILWTLHSEHGMKCTGVESSDWAIKWQEESHGTNDNYKLYNTNFELMDYSKLGKFDLIYACHVLEHLEDPMSTLEQCYKLLNKSGYLSMIVPDKEHQLHLHTHNWAFDKDVLTLWFKQLGLKNIKEALTKPYNGMWGSVIKGKDGEAIKILKEPAGHYIHICGQK